MYFMFQFKVQVLPVIIQLWLNKSLIIININTYNINREIDFNMFKMFDKLNDCMNRHN